MLQLLSIRQLAKNLLELRSMREGVASVLILPELIGVVIKVALVVLRDFSPFPRGLRQMF
jgi:hypothetical protein